MRRSLAVFLTIAMLWTGFASSAGTACGHDNPELGDLHVDDAEVTGRSKNQVAVFGLGSVIELKVTFCYTKRTHNRLTRTTNCRALAARRFCCPREDFPAGSRILEKSTIQEGWNSGA
jgi:hypothetical protein